MLLLCFCEQGLDSCKLLGVVVSGADPGAGVTGIRQEARSQPRIRRNSGVWRRLPVPWVGLCLETNLQSALKPGYSGTKWHRVGEGQEDEARLGASQGLCFPSAWSEGSLALALEPRFAAATAIRAPLTVL